MNSQIPESMFLYKNAEKEVSYIFNLNTSKKYVIPYEKVESDIDDQTLEKLESIKCDPKEKEITKLEHLRLIITNKCNLDCIYCYANGGSYNQELEDMNFETLKKSIDFFYEKYRWIHQISFFGGEPLIGIDLIEAGCKYICDYCDSRNILRPIFSLVTNGTLLDEHARDILHKYKIQINVSLDGPKDFNDKQRIYKSNLKKSVFQSVDNNVKEFRKKQKFSIESTCSELLNNYNYDFKYIENYFKKRYNIERVNVASAMIIDDVDKSLDLLGEKAKEKKLKSFVMRFFFG